MPPERNGTEAWLPQFSLRHQAFDVLHLNHYSKCVCVVTLTKSMEGSRAVSTSFNREISPQSDSSAIARGAIATYVCVSVRFC